MRQERHFEDAPGNLGPRVIGATLSDMPCRERRRLDVAARRQLTVHCQLGKAPRETVWFDSVLVGDDQDR